MFDIGWQELFVLAVLAVIVIGPKDLPRAMRTITKWIRKARALARDFQDGLDEVAREADLADLKKELDAPGGLDVAKKIGEQVDPTGEMAKEFDLDKDVFDEMSDAVDEFKDATDPGAGAGKDTVADTADAAAEKATETAVGAADGRPPKEASG